MNKKDMDGLFELLRLYFPNTDKASSLKLKNAWFLVLEPFEPGDVKAAVAQCLRKKKFFPDVTDVAAKCHLPEPMGEPETPPAVKSADPGVWMREWCATWRETVHRAGLLTASESKAQGMSVAEWSVLLDEAGL